MSRPQRETLRQVNVGLLRQAEALVASLPDEIFALHRVGGHVRHILEFYECLLDGAAKGLVDYDARRRDFRLERNRAAARACIACLIERLRVPAPSGLLQTRIEDADGLGLSDCYVVSSFERELLALSSHTVHHFALIATALAELGLAMDRDFGVAPSTLRYEAGLEAREAA